MSYASLAGPVLFSAMPSLPVEVVCQAGRGIVRGVAIMVQSAAVAAFLWLMVAAPGALVDHATTTLMTR